MAPDTVSVHIQAVGNCTPLPYMLFLACRHMQSLLRRRTPRQRRQCRGSHRVFRQALELLPLPSQTAKLMQLAATSALSRAKALIAMLELPSRCGYLLHDIDSHDLYL